MMQDVISLTERGTLTLPSHIRKTLGLTGGQQFIVAMTPQGEVLLRPAATIPLKIYSEERISEFTEQEALVGEWLKEHEGPMK